MPGLADFIVMLDRGVSRRFHAGLTRARPLKNVSS